MLNENHHFNYRGSLFISKVFLKGIILMSGLLFINWLSCCAESKPVVEIGKTQITYSDIENKVAIGQIYGNEGITEVSALIQLINKGLEYEIVTMHGINTTPKEIQDFSNHVDSTTKAPKLLVKIKEVFKGNRSEYGRLYLMPIIINRKLHGWYIQNDEIHKNESASMEKAFHLVLSDTTLEKAAQICSLNYTTFSDNFGGDMPMVPGADHGESDRPKTPMLIVVESLKEGDIFKQIVEDEISYRIVRLLHKDTKAYKVEMIYTQKRPFPEWFQEQASKISIVFHNQQLKDNIIEQYPEIWWVKNFAE